MNTNSELLFYSFAIGGAGVELLKLILNFPKANKALELNDSEGLFGEYYSLLHFACSAGWAEIVEVIVEYSIENEGDIDINQIKIEQTPLDLARKRGDENIVELLIEHINYEFLRKWL